MATTRIAFTACSKINFDATQKVWSEIAAQQPHHLLLLGDQIYMDFAGDANQPMPAQGLIGYELNVPRNIDDAQFEAQMRLRYRLQFGLPTFQALIRRIGEHSGTVAMVWDDHDFGFNNSYGMGPAGDKHVMPPAKKAIARGLFEEFRRNVERLRAGVHPGGYETLVQADWPAATSGVQSSHALGAARVLMLDTRSFRYPPSAAAPDLLGAAQWKLVDDAIGQAAEPLVVIASGSPFSVKGNFSDQSWKQGGEQAYREYELLKSRAATAGRRIVFIGGDSHKIDLLPDATPGMVEIVCAAAAAPKGVLFGNPRHFGLLAVEDDGRARVQLFQKGQVEIDQALFA